MNPQNPNPYTNPEPQTAVNNPLADMQSGETVVAEIKRHPIGMFSLYFIVGLILLALGVVIFGFAPGFVTTMSRAEVLRYGTVLFLIITAICGIFVYIANTVYWGNRWIITSDSVTQVLQNGLFDKQSSQLSLANLEDVTAIKDGIMAHMFNYGVLKCETAGEHSKFTFIYCPHPEHYAQQILQARERFQQKIRGE